MKLSFNDVFQPKLFHTLKSYTKQKLLQDSVAGLIVGVVAIPLAIAFGIASGVGPAEGLITAILAGFIISAFGGSKVQIGGPTGAFIVIIYGIVSNPAYGLQGLLIATMMAGVILIALGVFKLGAVIKFIPYPIIIGFTAGIAVTIFTTQVGDVLGLTETVIDANGQEILAPLKTPGDFMGKWITYFHHLDSINWWNTAVSILSIIIIALTPKFSKKIPGSLVAIILMTVAVWLMKMYGGIDCIDTIGDRFSIKAELPDAVVPDLNWEAIKSLFPVAVTIAVLGAIESLLSAAVADGVISDRHDSNTELIAQGVANVVTPIFGGIPATGAIARTMTNINNGGKTPVAGIVHAIVLMAVLLFFGPLVGLIPMACLAGILIMVSYNMSEWRSIVWLAKNPKSDFLVMLVTFILTVLFDLTIAIEVGLLLAVILFIKRTNESTVIRSFSNELDPTHNNDVRLHGHDLEMLKIPPYTEVYEIDGPYFFGIANKFDEISQRIGTDGQKVRIIRMRKVSFIDSTGIHNLEQLFHRSQRCGLTLVLSGVNDDVFRTLEKAGLVQLIGRENIRNHINGALSRAQEIISA